MFGKQEIQVISEISIFNLIGDYARSKDYNVVYYKSLMPKIDVFSKELNTEYKYAHYMHLYKNEKMKISIYFDEYNLLSLAPPYPYYELYDMCDIERFLNTDEDKKTLFDRVKTLI